MHSGRTSGLGLDGADEGGKGTEGHLLLLLDGLDPLNEYLLLPVLIITRCFLLWQHPQLFWDAAASPGCGALILQQRSSKSGRPFWAGGVSACEWGEGGVHNSGGG